MDNGQHGGLDQQQAQIPTEQQGQYPVSQPLQQQQPFGQVAQPTSGMAVASLVLGILAILGAFVPLLNFGAIPFALVGLVLAVAGFVSIRNGKRSGRGIAIAGIVLGVVSLVVIVGMYGCAAAVASSTSNASSTSASASATATVSNSKSSSSAVQEQTRTVDDGLSFVVPKGWVAQKGSDGDTHYYPSANNHTTLLYTARETSALAEGRSAEEHLSGITSAVLEALGEANDVESSDLKVSGYPAKRVKANVALKDTGGSFVAQMCFVYASGCTYALIGGSMTGDYGGEIAACLDSLEVVASSSSASVQPSAGSAAGSAREAAVTNAVSPELKDALDSYEAFVDEYIEFMKRYEGSDDAASMMGDYLNYLQKYSELMAKINAIDANSLATADYAYYIEVTSRVSKKLLDASL